MADISRVGLTLILFVLFSLFTACSGQDTVNSRGIHEFFIEDIFTPAELMEEGTTGRPSFYTALERLYAMRLVADDGISQLWYCNRFLEIAVRDKASGEIWFSTPYDLERDVRAAGDTRNNIHSLLRLFFFDRQQNERRMSSFVDAVPNGQFGYRLIENGIEVQVLIGLKPQMMLVPPAAEANSFEELVISQIPLARDRNRLLAFYTRFSWGDPMSQVTRNNLLENFPGILEHDLFILRPVNEREMRLLEEIIVQTDYTWDDFYRDLEIAGVSVELARPPMFRINVSFTLDNGDLVVNLPAYKIEYDNSMYVLSRIHLLEFFGAGRGENDGYMFVPDGSGALINFNNDSSKPVALTILPLYGDDVVFLNTSSRDNIRNAARFPVFGLRERDRAWFAIVEDGEAMADIVAQSSQFFSGYETVSLVLHYGREQLVTQADDVTGARGSFRFMDRNFFQGSWTIRYVFLTGDDADYNGMAAAYRNHLIERGILTPLENPNPAIYLDVLGLLQRPDTFWGIPYSRRIQLTTFEQAGRILANLYQEGVGQAVLRYRGWFNGGLDHTVPNRLRIERALGGRRGLEALTQTAAHLGYSTFFEADFYFVRRLRLFSGYRRLSHSSQTIDGFRSLGQPIEMISNAGIEEWNYYTISPNQHTRFFTNFTRNIARKNINGLNVSISSAGTNLLADYHRRRPVNLQQSRNILVSNMARLTDRLGRIIVDGGNAYTLPFAAHIMNIPVACSSHVNTDITIPFMQLVLHGFVSYSGPAINMSFDPHLALLRNIEFGAAPSFVLAYGYIAELKGTPYSVFYSINYHAWRDIMLEMYHSFAQAYKGLANIPMERHDRLSEGVYMTSFANGARVLVNYNQGEAEVNVNGITLTIASRSFEVVRP